MDLSLTWVILQKKTTDSIADHDMIQLANRSFAKVVPSQIPQTS